MRPVLMLALLLSACAAPGTHTLVGECWQDDPASVRVVEDALANHADAACRAGWTLVSRAEIREADHKEIHWTIACDRS